MQFTVHLTTQNVRTNELTEERAVHRKIKYTKKMYTLHVVYPRT